MLDSFRNPRSLGLHPEAKNILYRKLRGTAVNFVLDVVDLNAECVRMVRKTDSGRCQTRMLCNFFSFFRSKVKFRVSSNVLHGFRRVSSGDHATKRTKMKVYVLNREISKGIYRTI